MIPDKNLYTKEKELINTIVELLKDSDNNAAASILINTLVRIADGIVDTSTPEILRVLANAMKDIADDIEQMDKQITIH